LDGKIGNFPSLVVDECDENGEPLTEPEEEEEELEIDLSEPPSRPPPQFAPPAGEKIFFFFASDLMLTHKYFLSLTHAFIVNIVESKEV
jgi:hypothetical protein